jgi:hypothetical protein
MSVFFSVWVFDNKYRYTGVVKHGLMLVHQNALCKNISMADSKLHNLVLH